MSNEERIRNSWNRTCLRLTTMAEMRGMKEDKPLTRRISIYRILHIEYERKSVERNAASCSFTFFYAFSYRNMGGINQSM